MKISVFLQHIVPLCALLCFVSACSENADAPPLPTEPAAAETVPSTPVPDTAEEAVEVEEDDPFEEFEVESDDEMPPPVVDAKGGIRIDATARLPKYLAEYNLFKDPANQVPNTGLIPYYLNTGHFSDNAAVMRFIWLPPGKRATFHPIGRFTFPPGTALIQTFSYSQKEDPAKMRLVETRVLLNQPGKGWNLSSYKWDATGTSARKAVAGGLVPVSYVSAANEARDFDYLIPNKNDCKRCHENEEVVFALGLTARNLNRDVDYGAGTENQLAHWIKQGLLDGVPEDLSAVEKGPEWSDPATGSVTERARMWLDVNCAHCHNPKGAGSVSGLDLS
ncbi:MAG: hypothetical protein L3K26_04190, partial [Candidatus Hydrogenedentes bacterium]|nr:hypothetical protein [Candidatus Hydrogenedentota bacterium]